MILDAGDKHIVYESSKKSPIVAMVLNFFLPGAGYAYCGKRIAGIITFCAVVILMLCTFGLLGFLIFPLLALDGVRAAGRANRQLAANLVSG